MERENLTYALIERITPDIGRSNEDFPHLQCRFRKMPRVFELSHRSDARLREGIRDVLPADLSSNLVTDAERLVDDAGKALRERLYDLFSAEITAAFERERKLSDAHRAAVMRWRAAV